MKKLALAVAVAAISGQAAAVEVFSNDNATLDVYGQLRTRLVKTNNQGENKFDVDNSRIGTIGNYKLNEDLTATGKFVVKYNETAQFFSDEIWVGLASQQVGEARIGRQFTIWDGQMGKHDFTFWNGGSATMGSDAYGTNYLDKALDYRLNIGQVTVFAQHLISPMDSNSRQEGLSFGEFRTGDTDKVQTQDIVIDQSNSIGATWNSDFGLTVSGVYAATKLDTKGTAETVKTPEVKKSDFMKTKSMGLSASYSIEGLTIGGQLSKVTAQADTKSDFDQTKKGYGLGASYNFGNGFGSYATYDYAKVDNKGDKLSAIYDKSNVGSIDYAKETNGKTQSLAIGMTFRPASSVLTWAEIGRVKEDTDLMMDKDKKTEKSTKTVWAVGARYFF